MSKQIQFIAVFISIQLAAVGVRALDQGYTNFKSSVSYQGAEIFRSTTTATVSTTTNNFNWPQRPIVRQPAANPVGFTGFANGSDGIAFTLFNISTNTITIVNQSTFSSSANRVTTGTGADVALASGDSRTFWYDSSSTTWRIKR